MIFAGAVYAGCFKVEDLRKLSSDVFAFFPMSCNDWHEIFVCGKIFYGRTIIRAKHHKKQKRVHFKTCD